MSNAFSKEERVAFENLLEGFQDALVLSRVVSKYTVGSVQMARTGDTIWRPQPYIAQSFDGMDQTSNFKSNTQLSVPATLGYSKSVPWTLDAKELRDLLQEGRITDSAHQKLASDINVAISTVAAQQGTLVVARSSAASGFDDLAAAESLMNEQGVPMYDRYAMFATRDYNSMASNLAARYTMTGKPTTAYEKATVGEGIANFTVLKGDYGIRKAAKAGSGVTFNGGTRYYTPKARSTAGTGESANVDNRTMSITVNDSTGVAAGDSFTIAGVYALHHITKQNTGQLKTFRVISVPDGTHLVISPPIISNGGSTDAEAQYQNVSATPATNAAITFLNTTAGYMNPFWQKDALEILPGHYAVPDNAGVQVLRGSTDQGIEVVMQKFYDINTMVTKYRVDTLFGCCMKQPEMAGVLMFGQA